MLTMLPIEIDTKGFCLLCLQPNSKIPFSEENETIFTAFKMLTRYLKVDLSKVANLSGVSSSSSPFFSCGWDNNANLSVPLCEDCSSVTNDFLELFQALENIRLQLDLCVRQLFEFIEKGDKDLEGIQEFRKRMNDGKQCNDQDDARIVEILRNETREKVLRKINTSLPRVAVKDITENGDDNIIQESAMIPEDSLPVPVDVEVETPNAVEIQYPDETTVTTTNEYLPVDLEESPPVSVEGSNPDPSNCDHELESFDVEDLIQTEQHKKALSSLLRCDYCPKSFQISRRRHNTHEMLEDHQYREHAAPFLIDKGRLPPNISEHELNTALESITGSETSSLVQCPFCPVPKVLGDHLRLHLLMRHLPHIIEIIEKDNCENNNQLESPEIEIIEDVQNEIYSQPEIMNQVEISSAWQCVHCKEHYFQFEKLEEHQINMHTMAYLQSKGVVLPHNFSEEQLETALREVLDQRRSLAEQCPLCGTFDGNLRAHLVKHHLAKVIEIANQMQTCPVLISTVNTVETRHTILCQTNQNPNIISQEDDMESSEGNQENSEPLVSSEVGANVRMDCGDGDEVVQFQAEELAVINDVPIPATCPVLWIICVYCGNIFAGKHNLETHQFKKHSMQYLSDKGLLPPNISEQQFCTALARFLRQMMTSSASSQCPLCNMRGCYPQNLRVHLLQKHLQEVIDMAKNVPDENNPGEASIIIF